MREALDAATRQLSEISDTPRLDAELLMADALGATREALLLGCGEQQVPPAFAGLLARRLAAEPLAYITGTKAFWSIELAVTPDVLIPRPDSEVLIATALAQRAGNPPRTVLDLGTGSGALLLATLSEWPDAVGLGVDESAAALTVAKRNARHLGLATRAHFKKGDWCEGLADRFDLILCNPPYVDAKARLAPDVSNYEPHGALYAGEDGLDDYKRLIPQLPAVLARGGIVVLEIGHSQLRAVAALAHASGFTATCHHDLAGRERCLLLRRRVR